MIKHWADRWNPAELNVEEAKLFECIFWHQNTHAPRYYYLRKNLNIYLCNLGSVGQRRIWGRKPGMIEKKNSALE